MAARGLESVHAIQECRMTRKSRDRDLLVETLHSRFDRNMHRHPNVAWEEVLARLDESASAWRCLSAMEASGGEPDVIGLDKATGRFIFCDCSAESPAGRRSVCYDREGLDARAEHKPQNNAVDMAKEMVIELLTEEQYRELQKLANFDTKTSSWIKTPAEIRNLGGALFSDRRYGHVFVYHNGAPSYFGARGFRGSLEV